MVQKNRYLRNGLVINEEDQKKLKKSKVIVLGCGGIGGYVIEMLTRVGIGTIKVIDGDVFDETNLNRQLLATETNIGKLKVLVAKKRIKLINHETVVEAFNTFIDKNNVKYHLNGYDLVIDGLDKINTRKMVVKVCSILNIPYIYGAIAGWYGQVATIMPKKNILNQIYKTQSNQGHELFLGNPSFTPAIIASIQVSEVIKYLLGKGEMIVNGFLHIDLLTNEIEKIDIYEDD